MINDEKPGPLSGLRVIELAGLGPLPFCSMLLSDLGASVVRVDRPGGTIPLGEWKDDVLSRGRESIVVNLKHESGQEIVRKLADQADVFLEGFRPGVAERLGVGPETCLSRNPSLVYGRMTGWGQDGPMSQMAGHDIAYIALSGVLHAIGREDLPPQVPLNLLGDFGGGGMYLAVGVLAAVIEARLSGTGQVVDAAVVEGTAHLASSLFGFLDGGLWRDERGVNLLDTGAPFYDVYETADGAYLAVGALEPAFFEEFIGAIGIAGDVPEQYNRDAWPELRGKIASAIAQRTRDEWARVFRGTDTCAAPVLSLSEAPRHPHMRARDSFVELDGVTQPSPTPKFSRTSPNSPAPPVEPGSDTRSVLESIGIEDVDRLVSEGVVDEGI